MALIAALSPVHPRSYDPVHYMAPEGSYAVQPDGAQRSAEFRQMVRALHGIGLRVVLDVVYNHTFHSGGSPHCTVPHHSCDCGEMKLARP